MALPLPVEERDVYYDFHVAVGMGGGCLGFRNGRVQMKNGRKIRFECIGAVDVNRKRIEALEMLTGVKGTVMDLFSRQDYIDWNSKWLNAKPGRLLKTGRLRGAAVMAKQFQRYGWTEVLDVYDRGQYKVVTQLTGDLVYLWDYAQEHPVVLALDSIGNVVALSTYDLRTGQMLHDEPVDIFLMLKRVEPPEGWSEVTPDALRALTGGRRPDCIFYSLPCKGFSGLQSTDNSESKKYQALNHLSFRAVWLTLEAWKDDPRGQVPVHVFENVPRIKDRGEGWLSQVKQLYEFYGMKFIDGIHDLGKFGIGEGNSGGFAHRLRYTLIARHVDQLTNFIYQPNQGELRPIKECITKAVPLPGRVDLCGPMHRKPRLEKQTWERLALIKKGKDWRYLGELVDSAAWKEGRYRYVHLRDNIWQIKVLSDSELAAERDPATVIHEDPRLGHTPMGQGQGTGAYSVMDMEKPSMTVTGDANHRKASGAACIADPRLTHDSRDCYMQVEDMDRPARAITAHSGEVTRSNGTAVIADSRIFQPGLRGTGEISHPNKYAVADTSEPYVAVTAARLGSGQVAIADPRLPEVDYNRHDTKFRVQDMEEPARCVDGNQKGVGSGQACIADPRLAEANGRHHTKYRVQDVDQPAYCVDSTDNVAAGQACIADPRVKGDPTSRHATHFKVHDANEPASTVAGSTHIANGAMVIADPRLNHEYRNGVMGVMDMDKPAMAVIGHLDVHAGAAAIADPRLGEGVAKFNHCFRVTSPDEPAGTVASGSGPTNGAIVMADSRLNPMDFMVASADNEPVTLVWEKDNPPIILSLEGDWHRPLSIFELALLQGFPTHLPDGRPLQLPGTSEADWRDAIGNAVPPPAAQAVAETVLLTLALGNTFDFDYGFGKAVWVSPEGEIVDGPFKPIKPRRPTTEEDGVLKDPVMSEIGSYLKEFIPTLAH